MRKLILSVISAFTALFFTVANAQITPPQYNPANVNITGGNINGTAIGGTTPAAGAFTDLTAENGYKIPVVLLQVAVPIGIAPSGTMAANGAVTLGTALNTTYSAGIWLYFPAGAVYAGSTANFYWTVMSSTTVGTVYNTTYIPGTSSFNIPSSPVAISAAGPGAYTGVVTEITVISVTVPANLLGAHGQLHYSEMIVGPNNANNKSNLMRFGGATVGGIGNFINNLGRIDRVEIRNMGRVDRQHSTSWLNIGSGATNGLLTSINTASNAVFIQTLQLSVATDYLILTGAHLFALPS